MKYCWNRKVRVKNSTKWTKKRYLVKSLQKHFQKAKNFQAEKGEMKTTDVGGGGEGGGTTKNAEEYVVVLCALVFMHLSVLNDRMLGNHTLYTSFEILNKSA